MDYPTGGKALVAMPIYSGSFSVAGVAQHRNRTIGGGRAFRVGLVVGRRQTRIGSGYFKKLMKVIHTFIVALLLFAGSAFAQSPVILFTDIESGPNAGGENNQGAIVTLYGHYFGAVQSSSVVTVGGGQVAAYKLWSDTKIAVAIGSSARTGNIVVHTLAGDSNGMPFRIRSANLYYVSGTGNDASDGSFATPWRTLLKARSNVAAGDIVYAMNGSDQTTNDGTGWRSTFTLGVSLMGSGTLTMPIAYVVYPNHSVTIGSSSGGDSDFGVRTQGDGVQYIVLAGFHLTTGGNFSALSLGNGNDSNWRIVGNDVTCPNALSNTGCLFIGADYTKVYGNDVHHSGINQLGSKFFHQVYLQSNHLWIGWNRIHDNNHCRGIQVHDSDGPNNYDLHIFGNEIFNDPCDGINLATVDPSKGVVEVYNNLIYHVGAGPLPEEGSADYACIYSADITNVGSAGSGVIDVYNNTMFDCGGFSVFAGDAGAVVKSGNNPDITFRLRNNVVQQLPGESYVNAANSVALSLISGDTNLWFGLGAPPAGFTNSLNADASFVGSASSDFHLQPGSPAIDTGLMIGGLFSDRDGMQRPFGLSIDLGAYEFRAATADLTVRLNHTGTFLPGQTGATYAITVYNVGTAPTSGVLTVADTLPPGLTATGFTGPGPGWNCTLTPLSCSTSNALAAGSSFSPITLTVNVSSTSLPYLTNIATVSGGGDQTLGNNSSSDPTVIAIPDLTISKTHSGNFLQGETGDIYRIIVTNGGTGPTSGTVTVVDTLPPSLIAKDMNGSGWNCVLATLTCTTNVSMAAGASYPLITLTVDVSLNAATSLINVATVSGGGEINTFDNSVRDLTIVVPVADLTISKSHTGNFFQGQTGAAYTISVTNLGPNPINGLVTVTDALPSGLTATAIAGSGWNCTLETLTCTRSNPLAVNASYASITVTVNVAYNAPASLTNSASVSAPAESNPSNNTANDQTNVTQIPDLTIAKSHLTDLSPGQTGAVYSIVVSNVGSAPTSGPVTVIDSLPAGLTATSIDGGPNWQCTLSSLSCTRSDALAAGASYSVITVKVDVASNAPSSVVNTATVSGGGENRTTNNVANDPTNIHIGADLTISKSHIGDFFRGETGVQYTVVVSNVGLAATVGEVDVTEIVPSGLTNIRMSGPGWYCPALTCSRTDPLDVSSSYPPITVIADVTLSASSIVTNSVVVSGGEEQNSGNDTAIDPTNIGDLMDVYIFLPHSGTHYQGETGITHLLQVGNSGSVTTVGVVTVTASLDAALTPTNIAGDGWVCDLPTLTCTTADVLAPGNSYPDIVVTSDVSPTAPNHVTVTATVSGGGDQWTPNNNDLDVDDIIPGPIGAISSPSFGGLSTDQVEISVAEELMKVGWSSSVELVLKSASYSSGLIVASTNGSNWHCEPPISNCRRSGPPAVVSRIATAQVVGDRFRLKKKDFDLKLAG